MITYAPGRWGLAFSCAVRGSVLPKSLVISVPCMILTSVLHYFLRTDAFNEHFDLTEPASNKVILAVNDFGMPVISQFMFVLGFLVVFRANQAYARWWEGGSLLLTVRGDWFNAFSSTVALCNDKPEMQEKVVHFQHRMLRLMSLLFGTALVQIRQMEHPKIEILGLQDFDQDHLKHLQEAHDKTELVLQWIQKLIYVESQEHVLDAPPPILSRIYNQLGNGISALSTVRKIAEFPIPFPVAQLITIMLMLHWVLTCLICAVCVKDQFWAGFLSSAVVMAFWAINYIAVELEMPFGNDLNDLPLQEMQEDMNASLLSLVHPKSLTVPDFGVDPLVVHGDNPRVTMVKEILSYASDGRMVWESLPPHDDRIDVVYHTHHRIVNSKYSSHPRGGSQSLAMHSSHLEALRRGTGLALRKKSPQHRDPTSASPNPADPHLDSRAGVPQAPNRPAGTASAPGNDSIIAHDQIPASPTDEWRNMKQTTVHL
mmetsp:Transcript_64084/g.122261  ORF Transcript_64084/g.122261 Transcript_64084/m.122261 type:complete len:485 (+) Transcript_64084:197-1651(+)